MAGRGRARTGSVYEHRDHYDVRITLPGGKRGRPVCLKAGYTLARAREIAAAMTERAAADIAAEERAVSVSAWCELWHADRRARGLTSVTHDEGRLGKWVLPVIGEKPMSGPRRVNKIDVELLVERLDEHVREARMSWKTAALCWGNVTKMFKDASAAKTRSLRVRDDNPTVGVVGPDKGHEKAKGYLYPSEFVTLVGCEAVPLRWRRVFAIAVYLYARLGELEVLAVSDVDFERGLIHIHRALDRESGRVLETKTGVKRRIPIEPHIRLLLEVLCREAAERGDSMLLVMPPESDLSDCLRRYLRRAGVTREDLFANDLSRKQLTFHDLRATGITWMAVRGDDPLRIQTRAGHERFDTTQGYIREAENLEGAITPGETFPSLPDSLLSSGSSSPTGGASSDPSPTDGVRIPLGTPRFAEEDRKNGSATARGLVAAAESKSAESHPPDADDALTKLRGLRRLAEQARELAAECGGNDAVVLHLLATEIAGELDEAADTFASRRAS